MKKRIALVKSGLSAAKQTLWKRTPNKPKETLAGKIMLGVSIAVLLAALVGIVAVTAILVTTIQKAK